MKPSLRNCTKHKDLTFKETYKSISYGYPKTLFSSHFFFFLQIFDFFSRYSFYGLKSLRDSVVGVSHSRINIKLTKSNINSC